MTCLRVARLAQDHLNAAIFLREPYPDKKEVARTLYDDTNQLGAEAGKFVRETSFDRWTEIHTMDHPLTSSQGKDRMILKVAAGETDPELEQWKATLVDLPPSGPLRRRRIPRLRQLPTRRDPPAHRRSQHD